MKPVVVLGEALFDVYASAAECGPGEARGRRPLGLEGHPGGAPCNVAAWLASSGIPVTLATGFADDLLGDELRTELSARGIDLSGSARLPGTRTPLAVVTTGPGGERSFRLYLQGTPVEQLQRSDLPATLLERAGWFHFGGVLPAFPRGLELTRRLFEEARRHSVVTSCDVNVRSSVWEEGGVPFRAFLHVLKGVDLLKVSAEDFDWMRSQCDGMLNTPADLLQLGIGLVAFTRGSEGAELLAPGVRLRLPPPRVNVVDTTGAGDAFTAGLIASLMRNNAATGGVRPRFAPGRLREAGAFATEVAARALSRRGAMPPVETAG